MNMEKDLEAGIELNILTSFETLCTQNCSQLISELREKKKVSVKIQEPLNEKLNNKPFIEDLKLALSEVGVCHESNSDKQYYLILPSNYLTSLESLAQLLESIRLSKAWLTLEQQEEIRNMINSLSESEKRKSIIKRFIKWFPRRNYFDQYKIRIISDYELFQMLDDYRKEESKILTSEDLKRPPVQNAEGTVVRSNLRLTNDSIKKTQPQIQQQKAFQRSLSVQQNQSLNKQGSQQRNHLRPKHQYENLQTKQNKGSTMKQYRDQSHQENLQNNKVQTDKLKLQNQRSISQTQLKNAKSQSRLPIERPKPNTKLRQKSQSNTRSYNKRINQAHHQSTSQPQVQINESVQNEEMAPSSNQDPFANENEQQDIQSMSGIKRNKHWSCQLQLTKITDLPQICDSGQQVIIQLDQEGINLGNEEQADGQEVVEEPRAISLLDSTINDNNQVEDAETFNNQINELIERRNRDRENRNRYNFGTGHNNRLRERRQRLAQERQERMGANNPHGLLFEVLRMSNHGRGGFRLNANNPSELSESGQIFNFGSPTPSEISSSQVGSQVPDDIPMHEYMRLQEEGYILRGRYARHFRAGYIYNKPQNQQEWLAQVPEARLQDSDSSDSDQNGEVVEEELGNEERKSGLEQSYPSGVYPIDKDGNYYIPSIGRATQGNQIDQVGIPVAGRQVRKPPNLLKRRREEISNEEGDQNIDQFSQKSKRLHRDGDEMKNEEDEIIILCKEYCEELQDFELSEK